jgi:hypothetical protein
MTTALDRLEDRPVCNIPTARGWCVLTEEHAASHLPLPATYPPTRIVVREVVDTRDSVTDPDVIGAWGLEYDGPRCGDDDCRTPVGGEGERCPECAA